MKKANTASTRAGLAKLGRRNTLSDAEKAKKKADSDASWERLMAHAAAQKAKTNEEAMAESKMSELHASISDHMDKHIDHYKKIGGAEHLMHKADEAAKKISIEHGISHNAAYKHISDHIESKLQEEVAVNNVGNGNIAGTQGDAGKKPVMTKEPLKRKKLIDFKEWLEEAAVDSKGHKSSTGGLTQKGRDYYNNKTGGNLQAPVTTKPSKLKPGSKAANRRKSFCARMGGMKKRLTSAKTANDPDSRINKALRKWNC